MLKPWMKEGLIEAGCDEAGRGCLCGPVACAAVILPPEFRSDLIDDSKKLSEEARNQARLIIEDEALAWSVVMVSPEEIDRINILRASILGMQRALDNLKWQRIIPSPFKNVMEINGGEKAIPEHILIDGNHFSPYLDIPYTTVVHGDAKYLSIAAASILAKTYRDGYMRHLATKFPGYGWETNMGYPTQQHKKAIASLGLTPHHRRSYKPCQPSLFDNIP